MKCTDIKSAQKISPIDLQDFTGFSANAYNFKAKFTNVFSRRAHITVLSSFN